MNLWTSRNLGALLLGIGMGLVLGRFSPWLALLAPAGLIVAGALLWSRRAEPLALLFVLALSASLLLPGQGSPWGGRERPPAEAPARGGPVAERQSSADDRRAWHQIQHLVVLNSTGDVHVEGGHAEPQVIVQYFANRAGRSAVRVPERIQADYQQGTLTVVGLDPRGPLEARYGLRANLIIQLPSEVSVEVENGVGAVEVREVAGARVQSGVGDVHLANIAGSALVRSGVGTLALEDVAGGIDAKTRVGEIALSFNQPLNAPLVAEAEVGSVSLSVPRDSNITVRALSDVRKFSGDLERVTAGERRLRLGLGHYPVELHAHVGEVAVRAR